MVSISLMVGLRFIVLNTRARKAMRAVSYSHTAAALMGSVDRIITFTFVLGSMLAAAAGVLVALKDPKIEPYMGIMPGLKAFVAAVVGGIGNIPGAVLGGLVMGIAEVMVVEALAIAERGKGGELAGSGFSALGGKLPVNPSGGLKSKGHPVGATGVAQVREAVLQLRGECGARQVKDARWGLTQNMGGTGASTVIHIFTRA